MATYKGIQGFTIQNLSADPSNPIEGQVWYNSTSNVWKVEEVTTMQRTPDGRWMASLELNHGHHRYLFLVDGEPMLDPNATGIARDDQNNRVSLIAVS